MKKGFFSTLCFVLALLGQPVSANTPHLIDVTIEGSFEAPMLSSTELQFDVGSSYLLVLTNNNPFTVSFHYGKFGQNVFTHYIQGISNLTQESLVINPHSKLFWHFIPKEAGEFAFHTNNNGFNQQGREGKIIVTKIEKETKTADVTQAQTVEAKPEEKKEPEPQKGANERKRGGRKD